MTHRCNLQTTGTADFNSPWFSFFFFLHSSHVISYHFLFIICRRARIRGSPRPRLVSYLQAALLSQRLPRSLWAARFPTATFPIKRRCTPSFRIAAPDVSRLRVGEEIWLSLCFLSAPPALIFAQLHPWELPCKISPMQQQQLCEKKPGIRLLASQGHFGKAGAHWSPSLETGSVRPLRNQDVISPCHWGDG